MTQPSTEAVPNHRRRPRRILPIIAWLFGGLFSIATLLLLAVILINLHDEPLNRDALNLLNSAPKFNLENNSYLQFLAIDAADPLLMVEVGRSIGERDQQLMINAPAQATENETISYKKLVIKWQPISCGANCVEKYVADRSALQKSLDDNRWLVDRYTVIRDAATFEELPLASLDSPIPSFHSLVMGSEMTLMRAVYSSADGNVNLAIDELQRNDLFIRNGLRNAHSLIAKMVFIAMGTKQTRVIGELMKKFPNLLEKRGDAIVNLLRPLDHVELSFAGVLKNEARLSLTATVRLATISGGGTAMSAAGRWFYQPNATANLLAAFWVNFIDTFDVMPDQFVQAEGILRHRLEPITPKPPFFGIGNGYNPMGKVLMSIGSEADQYLGYLEKCADLDGYLRLSGLAAEIERSHIGKDQIPAFVENSPGEFRSPYDGKPMIWDANSGRLEFYGKQGLGSQKDAPFVVEI